MPFPKVEVAIPVTAKVVVVALVVVERRPVKFCRVVEPFASSVCAVSDPTLPLCAKRLVLEAFVAKVLVLVLLVIVALVPRRLVKSALVAESTEAKKFVLVLFVLVLFKSVTFCSVVEPFARIFCAESDPTLPLCANRLVEDALVAKVLVVVALVIVAFAPNRLVKLPSVALKIDAKKLVEVELVLVLFNSVRFWKVDDAVNTFCPEKVLLLARRVVEAPVGVVLQPNAPLL